VRGLIQNSNIIIYFCITNSLALVDSMIDFKDIGDAMQFFYTVLLHQNSNNSTKFILAFSSDYIKRFA